MAFGIPWLFLGAALLAPAAEVVAEEQLWRVGLGTGNVDSVRFMHEDELQRAVAAGRSASIDGEATGAQFSVPLFAFAQIDALREGRRVGYRLAVDGWLQLHAMGGDIPAEWTLGAAFKTLHAGYRRYVTADIEAPFYAGIAVDGSGAEVRWQISRESQAVLPGRLSLELGMGRIYPIAPRLRLAKLEHMLRQAGLLNEALPASVERDIELAWWALREELGYDRHMLAALDILRAAQLVADGIDSASVYRLGRIITDDAPVSRREGHDTTLALVPSGLLHMGGPRDTSGAAWAWVLEARHQHVFNLSLDADLQLDATLAGVVARGNVGSVGLSAAATQGIPFASIALARLVAVVPAEYRLFYYDDFLNLRGVTSWRARVGLGLGAPPGASSGFGAWMGGGASYTQLLQRRTGVSVRGDVDVGYVDASFAYRVMLALELVYGAVQSVVAQQMPVLEQPPFVVPTPRSLN